LFHDPLTLSEKVALATLQVLWNAALVHELTFALYWVTPPSPCSLPRCLPVLRGVATDALLSMILRRAPLSVVLL
jgi:hypothetical protein